MMEMRLAEAIKVLEKELEPEPGVDSRADYQWWQDNFVAGIEHCVDVLSEIRDREDTPTNKDS